MRTTSSCLYWRGDFRATTQQEACQDEFDREHAQKYTGLQKFCALDGVDDGAGGFLAV